jgi:hypothetical protein
LINGTNTFDCTDSTDANCIGGGKKFETVFESGKKYRIRIINSAIEAHFQFSIDGHSLTVIGMDLVPLVPYTTDSVTISMGQRYDLIVEADAATDDYWMRAGWITACSTNENAANITGIVRYDSSSTAEPTTTSTVTTTSNCGDEPIASLVPYLAMDVGTFSQTTEEDLSFQFTDYLQVNASILICCFGAGPRALPLSSDSWKVLTRLQWTINSSSLYLNWSDPTIIKIFNEESIFPTDYNVVPLTADTDDEWTLYVIQDLSGFGLYHPIHLHGHDFWVVGQSTGMFDIETSELNLINPPRRDVASLPASGYLAMAFKKDNPGSWLLHCHIAWHASAGLSMQFVERESEIAVTMANTAISQDNCAAWIDYDVSHQ